MIVMGIITFFVMMLIMVFLGIKLYKTIPGKIAGFFVFIYVFSPVENYIGPWWDLAAIPVVCLLAVITDYYFEMKGEKTE